MSGSRCPNVRSRRARSLATTGLVLAVVAELSSVGLLGLSGWFVSACAVAGASTFSSFSYIAPSGEVRAFAMARIAGNYSKRLVLHAAALRRVATARSDLFDRAAATDRTQSEGLWSGDLLDRSMADADSAGMALIESTAPVAVTAALTVGGALAVAASTAIAPAAVLAAGAVVMAVIAHRRPGAAREAEQNTRKALRAELVTAVDAWTEMASLGAAEQLAARTTARFTRLDRAREAADRRRYRTTLITGLTGAATLTATTATGAGGAPDAAMLVFVALMSLGVLTQAEQLANAAEARATATAAHRRLTTNGPHTASATTVPGIRSWSTEQGIGFADYLLPPMALRPGRVLGATVARGTMLVVTGRSGSGKSTLLRALASSLRQAAEGRDGRPAVVAVAADDYLFTGTLGSNWRLADAALNDDEIDERLAELRLSDSGLTAKTSVGPGGRQLSGGELRRVYLGRALARHPHVLIVDEPTTGLDDRTARHVLGILTNLPDTTVVIALHDVPACLKSSGHVTRLPLDHTSQEAR
ncbi:ATP-binding cassette domain-containing protein [Streptomyces sporangiiformans]|uniref:ATP-binding cassette domain-containing protein n=1 Tax=Streptomyces sporangiiformans TaxID=2315329 RepID=A0A505DAK2_9ACTN|nr:ATP-binding cassette domain-containing protein [Streptomyces sporangiiformans]TPQ19442.1 ATP-binding cassette domain-containing protein [Streptomyces sporangiiformans]